MTIASVGSIHACLGAKLSRTHRYAQMYQLHLIDPGVYDQMWILTYYKGFADYRCAYEMSHDRGTMLKIERNCVNIMFFSGCNEI